MKLTWKEIFSQLDIGASTAAFYRDRYEPWFKFTGEGRHRRYDQESVEVLSCIMQLYAEGKTYEAITEALERSYGVPGEVVSPENRTTENQQSIVFAENTTVTNQQDFIEAIRDVFRDELSKRDEVIFELQEELSDMREELSSMKKAVLQSDRTMEDRDREVMERIRDIQTTIQQQHNKPWWQRLMGK